MHLLRAGRARHLLRGISPQPLKVPDHHRQQASPEHHCPCDSQILLHLPCAGQVAQEFGTEENWHLRNEQLEEIAEFVRDKPGHVVVLGDLNVTPWSKSFQKFTESANLRDSRRGFGVNATWPAWLGGLGIPIDHCLVSEGIVVRNVETGESVGSDHRPLIAEFFVKRP